jgi:hypothetical protein
MGRTSVVGAGEKGDSLSLLKEFTALIVETEIIIL